MMSTFGRLLHAALLAATGLFAAMNLAAAEETSGTVRIGFQRSSTLITILKANGEIDKALAAVGLRVSWHEFTSGLPLLEALNLGNIDFGADVADTVPVFAQAAGARLVFVAEEAASPSAQGILVPTASPIKSIAELKGRKVAVTKGAGSHFLLLVALGSAKLSFKDIAPVYLTPADGRAALVGGRVDAWVAWDPFLSSAQRQSDARLLADGTGLASYKRYYLATESFAARGGRPLATIFAQLQQTGEWVKAHPREAADQLAGIWGIDAPTVEQANSHRSYRVGAVTREGLTEQQRIADAFLAEGLLPRAVDTRDVRIWQPGS